MKSITRGAQSVLGWRLLLSPHVTIQKMLNADAQVCFYLLLCFYFAHRARSQHARTAVSLSSPYTHSVHGQSGMQRVWQVIRPPQRTPAQMQGIAHSLHRPEATCSDPGQEGPRTGRRGTHPCYKTT